MLALRRLACSRRLLSAMAGGTEEYVVQMSVGA